jgi:hypothetical protein
MRRHLPANSTPALTAHHEVAAPSPHDSSRRRTGALACSYAHDRPGGRCRCPLQSIHVQRQSTSLFRPYRLPRRGELAADPVRAAYPSNHSTIIYVRELLILVTHTHTAHSHISVSAFAQQPAATRAEPPTTRCCQTPPPAGWLTRPAPLATHYYFCISTALPPYAAPGQQYAQC